MPRTSKPRPVSEIIVSPRVVEALSHIEPRGSRLRPNSSSTSLNIPASAPDQYNDPPPEPSAPFPPIRNEKVVASGSGISVGIDLTEPVLYLEGYDHSDPTTKKSAILRGLLHLRVTKCVKIKKISICFRGHAQTDWPDGIPPRKTHFHDKKDLLTQGVVYFNHGDTASMQNDYGAHYYQYAKPSASNLKDGVTTTTRELRSKSGSSAPNGNGHSTTKEMKGIPLHSDSSHSFGKHDHSHGNHAQRNYRMFPVGDYLYSFEFPVDGSLPETIKTDLGFVRYDLEDRKSVV